MVELAAFQGESITNRCLCEMIMSVYLKTPTQLISVARRGGRGNVSRASTTLNHIAIGPYAGNRKAANGSVVRAEGHRGRNRFASVALRFPLR